LRERFGEARALLDGAPELAYDVREPRVTDLSGGERERAIEG
jgi:hypothetical protein